MRAREFITELTRRQFLKGLGGLSAAGALGYGVYKNTQQSNEPETPSQVKKPEPFKLTFTDQNPLRDTLVNKARKAGFKDFEIAHLISQVAHETGNFRHLEELGTPRYFKKYERGIHKDKKTGKIIPNKLGNIYPGDGVRFKGRGFIHLTGRENYRRAEQALGVPFTKQPDLAADPTHAADIAIWFWKQRVQPKVSDFPSASVQQVTKPINPGLKGLSDREAHFARLTNK